MKLKNKLLFMLYSICLGAIIGIIIWSFMRLITIGIELLWVKIPNFIHIPFYTILLCTIGGIIIGIWKKFTGDYPEDMEKVIEKKKKEGKYPYNKIGVMCYQRLGNKCLKDDLDFLKEILFAC